MPLDPNDLAPRWRQMRATWVLILVCGLILCFDIGGELYLIARYPHSLSGLAMLHIVVEFLATFGLGVAFSLIRTEMRRSLARSRIDREHLTAIRGDFDRLLQERFREWDLTPAESDVALLTIRGMKIADIARMRHAHDGTVKSQLSTIYRKSGTTTRTEFVARFIDDFLDHSASHAA